MTEIAEKTQTFFKRPPIVVVLGHVDHGKTTILSKIRQTKFPEEPGGITQHIGAYQVEAPQESKSRESETNRGIPHSVRDDFSIKRKITFLDTPGHEAFSAIRSRGAKVADIAILVIAADDGVKPQTKEAIKHIQDAKIPFIAALNKTDKPEAKPAMIKQQLAEAGVLVEGYGGQIPAVEISARTGKGVDELLELVLLTAELENLESNPDKSAEGVVIESHLDKKRGYIATLLIRDGTLKMGDYVVSGKSLAKLKMMEDFSGKSIEEATPSQPALTLGWSESPDVGEKFKAVETKEEADQISNNAPKTKMPIFISLQKADKENRKILNIVLKADTQGSLEAVGETIKNIFSEEVGYNVLGYGIGNIKDNDVKTVAPTNGAVYGFYVEVENSATRLAEKEKVKIKTFDIIYELVEELRKDLSNLLEPEIKRTVLGKLKVLKLFKKGASYQIVGGKIISGLARRGALIDVLRNDAKIGSGRLVQLQHNKADVEEVKEGLECGIKFEAITQGSPLGGPAEIQERDMLEIYEEERIKRSI